MRWPWAYDQVEVHAVAGDGIAVSIHRSHMADPSMRFRSLCLIDGDSRQQASAAAGIHKLPGDQPELTIFDAVADGMNTNIALLTVGCQLPQGAQGRTRETITQVRSTCRDPHLLFSQVGIALGFVPEVIVRGAFLSLWISDHRAELAPLVTAIQTSLSQVNQATPPATQQSTWPATQQLPTEPPRP